MRDKIDLQVNLLVEFSAPDERNVDLVLISREFRLTVIDLPL